MMIAETGLGSAQKGAIERTYGWLARLLAVYALASGLVYWFCLTGLAADPTLRFDLLPDQERLLFTTLALLLPTAALGLWMITRWGVVIWVLAATGEIFAYSALSSGAFPGRTGIASANVALLCTLLLISGAVVLERRAHRLNAR